MWHVSSRSGVVTLRTAIHLLLTYLLTYLLTNVLILFIRCIFLLTTFRPHLRLTDCNFAIRNVVLLCLLTSVLLGLNIALFYVYLRFDSYH